MKKSTKNSQKEGSEWRTDDIILTGGFPCQPYSLAGKRLGKNDDRHLWPEMLRVIREIKPTWIVGENVFGIVNWNGGLVFDEVQADLEAQGYEVQAYVLPACAVNAPHRRDRVWFVAYSKHFGQQHSQQQGQSRCKSRVFKGICNNGAYPDTNSDGQQRGNCHNEVNTSEGGQYAQRNPEQMGRDVADTEGGRSRGLSVKSEKARTRESNNSFRGVCGVSNAADTTSQRHQHINARDEKLSTSIRQRLHGRSSIEYGKCSNWANFPTVSPLCSRNDELSYRLDSITFSKWRNESIKAAGNAIVPAVVLQIFKAIEQYQIADELGLDTCVDY